MIRFFVIGTHTHTSLLLQLSRYFLCLCSQCFWSDNFSKIGFFLIDASTSINWSRYCSKSWPCEKWVALVWGPPTALFWWSNILTLPPLTSELMSDVYTNVIQLWPFLQQNGDIEQIIAGNINKPIWNTYYEFCPFCHVRNKRQTIRSAYFSVNTAIIGQSKYVVVVDKTTGLQC